MTPKTRPKKRADGTLNELCRALNLGKRRVSELLKQGMPDSPQTALAWREAKESDDSATALRRERIGLVRAQRHAAELANKRVEGELISRAEVIEQHIAIASATQVFLRKLERELPPLLLGLPLSGSLPAAKKYVRDLQNRLSQMDPELWKHLPKEEA